MAYESLVTFLYLLMRDSVVPGEVARLVKEVEKAEEAGGVSSFTNKHLEAYAREITERLV